MKTRDECKDMAEQLLAIKPKVRKVTFFGDDNWEAIDAQVRVLSRAMDEDDIYDFWQGDEDSVLIENALEAWAWMNNEPDAESPVEGWRDLAS